ncbi:hypothetical protein PG993_012032 [Apiospora rasikravindrae]|uniref:Uncharacterized protein n=1 Tax=Apiospora rasikravindrae TaxID=990691 RepID=A0ABR1S194_9PEZI
MTTDTRLRDELILAGAERGAHSVYPFLSSQQPKDLPEPSHFGRRYWVPANPGSHNVDIDPEVRRTGAGAKRHGLDGPTSPPTLEIRLSLDQATLLPFATASSDGQRAQAETYGRQSRDPILLNGHDYRTHGKWEEHSG